MTRQEAAVLAARTRWASHSPKMIRLDGLTEEQKRGVRDVVDLYLDMIGAKRTAP